MAGEKVLLGYQHNSGKANAFVVQLTPADLNITLSCNGMTVKRQLLMIKRTEGSPPHLFTVSISQPFYTSLDLLRDIWANYDEVICRAGFCYSPRSQLLLVSTDVKSIRAKFRFMSAHLGERERERESNRPLCSLLKSRQAESSVDKPEPHRPAVSVHR